VERPILKSPDEIEQMREANRIVARALKLMAEMVAPGVSTLELDQAAEELITKAGAIPAFKGYPGASERVPPFPATICASINEEVVHGIPAADRILQEGDIVSIDVGAEINGFFGDAAKTFGVGSISKKAAKLLEVTEHSLMKAITTMKPGSTMRRLAHSVQTTAEEAGFSVVRQFVGHGIGRQMHEPPQVPNYVPSFGFGEGYEFETGAVLAVEPMVNIGGSAVRVLKDGWTVITKDRTLSAHFEHSIAVTENGPLILTEI